MVETRLQGKDLPNNLHAPELAALVPQLLPYGFV